MLIVTKWCCEKGKLNNKLQGDGRYVRNCKTDVQNEWQTFKVQACTGQGMCDYVWWLAPQLVVLHIFWTGTLIMPYLCIYSILRLLLPEHALGNKKKLNSGMQLHLQNKNVVIMADDDAA